MLSNIKSILMRPYIIKDLWRSSLRTCQTASKEPESITKESSEDPDMFISDICNPFEKSKHICNPRLLSQFVSPYTGFLYDKHITGLCEVQQKRLIRAITRSQDAGFMAYRLKTAKYIKDPKLFEPFAPTRPNPH